MFKEFFAKNFPDFSYKAFLITKLQVLLIAIFAFAFFRYLIEFYWFVAVEVLLALYYLFVLLREVRGEFKDNFSAYFLFFFVLLVVAEAFWLSVTMVDVASQVNIFFYLVIFVIVFFILFKLFYGKRCFSGKVLLSDDKLAVVETDFDLFSFTRAGRHVIKTQRKYGKGEVVKIKVRGKFGRKILEVVD